MLDARETAPIEGVTHVDADNLRAFVVDLLEKVDVSEVNARITADVLVTADLRGVHSHGVARLQSYYVSRIRKGLIDPAATHSIVHETPVSLRVDGHNGLGQPTSYHTMNAVIEKARETGVALATVSNSNHYGIAGYYAMMALEENLIGICFTNTGPLVMPTFGKQIFTGTNPIAVAVPSKDQRPWVLDMATSVVPKGKLEVAARNNLEMPLGWAVDKDGVPTTEARAALDGGAPMPLGGTRQLGGHKGYDLAILVDIFSGVLSGGAFAPNVPGSGAVVPSSISHFFMAFQPDLFMPVDEFRARMDALIADLKHSAPALGEERVLVAGQPEDEAVERNLANGIPIDASTTRILRDLGTEFGVPFPA